MENNIAYIVQKTQVNLGFFDSTYTFNLMSFNFRNASDRTYQLLFLKTDLLPSTDVGSFDNVA